MLNFEMGARKAGANGHWESLEHGNDVAAFVVG
jgi:hypothetical protein